jgi:hypothetical protein
MSVLQCVSFNGEGPALVKTVRSLLEGQIRGRPLATSKTLVRADAKSAWVVCV